MGELKPTRRAFLAGSAGLVLAVSLPRRLRAQSNAQTFVPNAFIRVAPDNTVTVLVKHIEFGQGTWTGLTTMVADEMDADWTQMRAEHAPADASLYANALFGIQGTGGSTATPSSWMPMRQAGAAARAMLVDAAARTWDVPAGEITVSNGVVSHVGSGQSASFGDLATAAADSTAPAEPTLKTSDQFTLIGKNVARIEVPQKTNGTAQFTIDVFRDGMQTVAVAHPPKFGATVGSFDATAALQVSGVNKVEQIPSGVAVYADDTWAAFQGRDALDITWDDANAELRSTEQIMTTWATAARDGGLTAEETGDLDAAMADAAQVIEAEYRFPYLAHASMEPLDAVIEVREDGAEVWTGSQIPTTDQATIAGILGFEPPNVTINTMLTGGSFGRRAQPDNQFVAELAAAAKASGPGNYKLQWSREDDMTGGYYRPLTVHYMQGGLDADGNIVGWRNNVATQSILKGSPFEAMIEGGIDATSIEGSTRMPYVLPNSKVTLATMDSRVPVLWWRSVGHTHTAYATETFLDELLEKGGKDRVQGRLDILSGDAGRDRAVLERVAEISGWQGVDAGNGIARGVALHESFNSYVAMVADVSDDGGQPRVHKVWVAVDCGIAINPSIIEAQVAGAIGYGLSAAMFEEITLLDGGMVDQANYDLYRILRNTEMPEIEVSIMDSSADPTGIGEPGTPPIAPAVGNAWRALTGETPKRLPFVRA
ncbi:xanthine dehydrogenase family protein molybdopterin-binding subunit [Parasulfitobacter algicola]|uniref:Xanthine dehydrogenase family protein molybdopterin-binding subunit n=1 Tax=Parasulfitobacter algicola TaxID=2614809 RepID=A0ABX2IV93_9RHOB|nr:xanthine dehydrogenase family protein molybdopterin-binding subunit [Sulfitobacter algicola]NSX53963.1 xanthine dehydrogenase family protein molybdopterin-binding subunit [Sulfitobacter algicola]